MKGAARYPACIFIVACIQRTIFAVEPLCRSSLFNGESGHIPDSAFSSSTSEFPVSRSEGFYPARARMDFVFDTDVMTAWRTKTLNRDQYIQVDLGTASLINSIHTAGCGSSAVTKPCDEYVTKFKVQHSLDGNTWFTVKDRNTDKVFSGNSDSHGTVSNELDCPVIARFVRIIPQEWHNWITLKFDVSGCKIPAGMSSGVSARLHHLPTDDQPVADTEALTSSHFTISSNNRSPTVKGCIGGLGSLSCQGMPDGDYQHCVSCKKFISCSGNILTEFTCPSRLVWDNTLKYCTTVSSTCK